MLKTLHIIPSLCKGGAERLVLDICRELQQRSGVQVKLITFSAQNHYLELSESLDWEVIPAVFVPSIAGKATQKLTALRDAITTFAPEIIHTHLWEAEMVTRQIEYPKAKWFSHFHDNMRQLNNTFPYTKQHLTERYERWLMLKKYRTCNNHFVCISKDTQNYAKRVLPTYFRNQIYYLSNAIDYQRFYENKDEIPSKLQLISIGRLDKNKNHRFLIKVVEKIKITCNDVQFLIVGEGPERNKLESEIKSKELNKHIKLLGRQNNLEKLLWKSSIYVHAAFSEAFGLALIEAMAAGLPVVSLDGKGNRELIEQGKNGFMIFEENAELFAERILEIWQNKKLYRQMSQYAQEFAKKHDIKEYVDKLIEIYQS